MKILKFIYTGFLACLILTGCESEEDALTPSNADADRVGDFVNSAGNEYVSSVYETYNCGLMYEYDKIEDFAYTAESDDDVAKWANVDLPMIQELFLNDEGVMVADSLVKYNAYVDSALAYIDSTIFNYIDIDSYIATMMPFKVLLSHSIYTETEIYEGILTESDSRTGSQAIHSLNSVFNRHSIVFNVNLESILLNAEKFKKDNFYIFISRIMEMHDLYDEVPEDFSLLSSSYYGETIEDVYAEEYGIDLEDDADDAETVPDVVDKDWFYDKGFIDAKYFYNDKNGLTTVNDEPKAIKKEYTFVDDLGTDVRSYLNEMLHRNSEELAAFPDGIKEKMLILYNTLENWGVDLLGFNPDLEVILK